MSTTHHIVYGCGHELDVKGVLGSATLASCLAVMCDECCYRGFVKDPDGLLFYQSRADHGHDSDLIMQVTARKLFSYRWVTAMLERVLKENPDISKMYIRRHLYRENKDDPRLPDYEKLGIAAESVLRKYPDMAQEYALCSTEIISKEAFPLYFKLYPEETAKYLSNTTFRGDLAREIITKNS
jgi:hypothetical protein